MPLRKNGVASLVTRISRTQRVPHPKPAPSEAEGAGFAKEGVFRPLVLSFVSAKFSVVWPQKGYFVYIMSSRRRVLYVGVTNNLVRRAFEHKTGVLKGFSSKYKVTLLVYYESFGDVRNAIHREKEIKGWVRRKKIELIETVNPKWKDLSLAWYNPQSDEKLRKIFSLRNRMGPKGTL